MRTGSRHHRALHLLPGLLILTLLVSCAGAPSARVATVDLLWNMDRRQVPPAPAYEELVGVAGGMGFDVERLERVPQGRP